MGLRRECGVCGWCWGGRFAAVSVAKRVVGEDLQGPRLLVELDLLEHLGERDALEAPAELRRDPSRRSW